MSGKWHVIYTEEDFTEFHSIFNGAANMYYVQRTDAPRRTVVPSQRTHPKLKILYVENAFHTPNLPNTLT